MSFFTDLVTDFATHTILLMAGCRLWRIWAWRQAEATTTLPRLILSAQCAIPTPTGGVSTRASCSLVSGATAVTRSLVHTYLPTVAVLSIVCIFSSSHSLLCSFRFVLCFPMWFLFAQGPSLVATFEVPPTPTLTPAPLLPPHPPSGMPAPT